MTALTVEAVTAAYREALGSFETIVLRRVTGAGPNQAKLEVTVPARVMGVSDAELMGGIKQDNQRIILLAADLAAAQWPAPPKVGDQVYVRGRTRTVEFADDATKRLNGQVIAYTLRVVG